MRRLALAGMWLYLIQEEKSQKSDILVLPQVIVHHQSIEYLNTVEWKALASTQFTMKRENQSYCIASLSSDK